MTAPAERARDYRARKRAAGHRIVHGRWTDEPRRAPVHPDTEHGLRGYWRGCKCERCRAAMAAYQRDRYARKTRAERDRDDEVDGRAAAWDLAAEREEHPA